MNPTVQYTGNGVVITIPSASPGATHEHLMRGILAGIKGHLNDAERTPIDSQQIGALVELMQTAIPDEERLNKSYE